MLAKYRIWKHLLVVPLIALAYFFLRNDPAAPASNITDLKTGIGLVALIFIVYLAEELYWIFKRQGRPCSNCGKITQVKSFTLHTNCPACGLPGK